MKRHMVICDCGMVEHQLSLTYDPDEQDEFCNWICIEPSLSPTAGFFGRIKIALRYAFGHHGRYGHWDCILVHKPEARRMVSFIEEYLNA